MNGERRGARLAWDPDAEARDAPKPPKSARTSGGRFGVFNAFMDHTHAGLTPSARAVWLTLYRHVNAEAGTACLSQGRLAERSGVKERQVRNALAELDGLGLVEVKRLGRRNSGPSTYRIHPVSRQRSAA